LAYRPAEPEGPASPVRAIKSAAASLPVVVMSSAASANGLRGVASNHAPCWSGRALQGGLCAGPPSDWVPRRRPQPSSSFGGESWPACPGCPISLGECFSALTVPAWWCLPGALRPAEAGCSPDCAAMVSAFFRSIGRRGSYRFPRGPFSVSLDCSLKPYGQMVMDVARLSNAAEACLVSRVVFFFAPAGAG